MLARFIISASRVLPMQMKLTASVVSNRSVRAFHSTGSLFEAKTYYTPEHEWITVTDDVGTVGITAYAQEQLGDVVYCEVPEVGSEFAKGDAMAVVESVKAASDLYSPVSGEVVDTNGSAVDNPEIIKESPMDEGWLIKLKLSDPTELEELLNADDYAKLIRE